MIVYCVFRWDVHESTNDLCHIASTQGLAEEWVKENALDKSPQIRYDVFEWTIDGERV